MEKILTSVVTPTLTATAYSTGQLMGGKLTFSNVLDLSTCVGYLRSVLITDLNAQAVDLDLVLFHTDPTNTTFTNAAAFTLADADIGKVLCALSFGSANRFAFADNSIKYIAPSGAVPLLGFVSNAPSRTLYGALIARGAHTSATASDITIKLFTSQNYA